MSKKGTEPCARPMGMPCRKYSSTSSRKLLWSLLDSSKKPLDGASVVSSPSLGTSSSSEKLALPMSEAAWLDGVVLSNEACLRRCSNMTPFILVALLLASPPASVGLWDGRPAPRFLDREARLLIGGGWCVTE